MIIHGAFDTHVHFAPHAKVKANTDALTLGKHAVEHEMAGMVLKCNYFPSVPVAYLVHQTYPRLKVYGGIVMNPSVGGVNPMAVKTAIAYGEGKPGEYCRFVCLPTFYSKRDVQFHHREEEPIILVQNNRVIDDLRRVFDLIAEHSLALLTGHVGEDELFPVVEQAKSQGVSNIVVGHPCSPVVDISLEAQRQLGQMGAVMQQCCVETYPYYERKYGIPGPSYDDLANAIRYVGTEHCILATDMGGDAGFNPPPADGFATYIEEMAKRGFTEQELTAMCVTHPLALYTDGLRKE